MEDNKRKKMSWTYSLTSHSMEAQFPTGERRTFNLSTLVVGMSPGQEVMFHYGVKQWMSSNAAAFKTATDKIVSFDADFKGLSEKGVELRGEGQIGILGEGGKARAPKTQDALILPKMSTFTDEEIKSIVGSVALGLITLSDEVKVAVMERFQTITSTKKGK